MAKLSLAGFKDPVRRPRYIIWSGVAVLAVAAVLIVTLGVTSTRWFCAEGCHKVQDDTIVAYQHSSHKQISCMACHMPVSANPVTFMLHKAEALGELYLTVTDNFELPLNGESEVSLTMTSKQCTQCHALDTRVVTAAKGMIMDHEPHKEINAACPVCHNRVAHREDFELTGKDPKTGTTAKHVDFMTMTACFRCHGIEEGAAAPGTCPSCHTPEFNLKPPSHNEADFYPKGHAEMAKEMKAESDKAGTKGSGGEDGSSEETSETGFLTPEKAHASEGGTEGATVTEEDVPEVIAAQRSHGASDDESIGEELPQVESIFYCATCHAESFCAGCHGMEMPHPKEFKEPKDAADPQGHPAASKVTPDKCVMCHGANEETHFCDDCHHGTAIEYVYDKTQAWAQQHPKAVAKSGPKSCLEDCHTVKFCEDCHSGRKVVPESHNSKDWTKTSTPTVTVYGKKPAEPSAQHALEAQKSIESCAICHGDGGVNAAFCKGCHRLEMPHTDDFRKQHVTGKKTPQLCSNCHNWRQLCSNCHHIDSSFSKSWIKVHGASTNKNGTAGCIEACHKKIDCVNCHQKRDVVPASHADKKFVRDYSSKPAKHVELYTKNGDVCTYCHKGEVAQLPNSGFCRGCHNVDMPHPAGYGLKDEAAGPKKDNSGTHTEDLKKAIKLQKECANCHRQSYCDSCHHQGLDTKRTWKSQHNTFVKKNGASTCFGSNGGCHEETFCSYCHVRLSR